MADFQKTLQALHISDTVVVQEFREPPKIKI